ncbi:MAG: hypothetical protein M3367_03080 [Acidobacteriota bacterium]|nr:hypothetical protein [Acidobacteriota bacterium]
MPTDLLIKLVVGLIGQFLVAPMSAAKYAKYFLRARDYLNILFPLDVYPENTGDTTLAKLSKEDRMVPVKAVKEAMKKDGFNIPFVKGR